MLVNYLLFLWLYRITLIHHLLIWHLIVKLLHVLIIGLGILAKLTEENISLVLNLLLFHLEQLVCAELLRPILELRKSTNINIELNLFRRNWKCLWLRLGDIVIGYEEIELSIILFLIFGFGTLTLWWWSLQCRWSRPRLFLPLCFRVIRPKDLIKLNCWLQYHIILVNQYKVWLIISDILKLRCS